MFDDVDPAWLELIDQTKLQEIETAISSITPDNKLCPPKHQWFEWARLTPLSTVKVVIIGQDPYPTAGEAHGLAFSSKLPKCPASLANIYKCLMKHGLIETMPLSHDLTPWTQRGVLLLNSALSTEVGKRDHHTAIWDTFVPDLIMRLSTYGRENNQRYVFMLWGKKAHKIADYVDKVHHTVLQWLHPSPMAQASSVPLKRFINCPHFTQVDIDWSLPVGEIPVDDQHPTEVNEVKTEVETDPRIIQVFTDGSCESNGKKSAVAGYAVVFVSGPLAGKNFVGTLQGKCTNIRAEGKAIWTVLKKIGQLPPEAWDRCYIYTDSQFWIDMLTKFMPSWNADKFDKKANSDMTKPMWNLWSTQFSDRVEFVFTPAHNKQNWQESDNLYKQWCFKYNDKADRLACKASSGAYNDKI